MAGAVVVTAGFHAAFPTLAAIAALALTLFAIGVPETAGQRARLGAPTAE